MDLSSGIEACPSETLHLRIYVFQSLWKLYSKREVVRREKVGVGGVFTKGNALSNASVLAGLPMWVAVGLVRSDWEVRRDGASYAEVAECAYI